MLRIRSGRGFSLIELMVALALLGFLLLLGLPAFTTMVKNTQIRTVADALQNGIRLARAEALRQNQSTVFALTNGTPTVDAAATANGRSWWVQTISRGSNNDASAVTGGTGVLTDVASGISITGPAVLCFNTNGRLSAVATPLASGTTACTAQATTYLVKLSQGTTDRQLNVTVAIGGQVRMCDPNRPASAPDGC